MEKNKKRSNCPISYSLDIWWDKWSLLILRDLFFMDKCTYGDFLKSPEKIATNILASKLQNLEENSIIEKMHNPESKIKVPYRLTEKGINLLPLFVETYLWAERYFDIPDDVKLLINEAKKNKEEFILNLKIKLMKKLEE